MHAETEGNEPSPSEQLCKCKSRKSWQGIGHKYKNTRQEQNIVEMCNWGEKLPGPWHGGGPSLDTDTLVSWLPIRSEWAIICTTHTADSLQNIFTPDLKYIHPWLGIYSPLTKHSAANVPCITPWREAYPSIRCSHLLIRIWRRSMVKMLLHQNRHVQVVSKKKQSFEVVATYRVVVVRGSRLGRKGGRGEEGDSLKEPPALLLPPLQLPQSSSSVACRKYPTGFRGARIKYLPQ